MKKRNNKTKYSIGSLLLLLAFTFYIACNPDKGRDGKQSREATEIVTEHEDSLVAFTGKVVSIKDGDTFEVLHNGKSEKVRLVDIDAPESSQPFGKAAKKYASGLCYGKMVKVEPKGKRDQFGRILGVVYTAEGLNVNEEMVRGGLAWRYKYSKDKTYILLQKEAKELRKGLWADENPINPWQWRKDNKQAKKDNRQ